MNWKAEALEKLSGYNARKQAVQSLAQELEQYEQTMGNDTGMDTDDQTLNRMVKRAELGRAYQEARLWVNATDNAVKALSEQEQQLLKQLYIDSAWGNLRKLEEHTGLTRSTLYRKRDQALRKFTLALYGNV